VNATCLRAHLGKIGLLLRHDGMVMRRIHFLEIGDQPWCPRGIRRVYFFGTTAWFTSSARPF